jgi:RecB family endonuclease NucS
MISRLEYVELREVWRHEATDFTVWLAENIDFLNDALQVNLNVIETEKQIGSFNVDIFCEDGQGAHAIIENQLEKTDHTHLGQLLTYSVGVDAKTIIWVTSHPRQEHIRVVEWLNEITPADMGWYLVFNQAI